MGPLAAVNAVTRGRVSMLSTIDSERFAEAQYYVTTYGTAEMLVTFLMRHDFLVQACRATLTHALPPMVTTSIPLPTALPFSCRPQTIVTRRQWCTFLTPDRYSLKRFSALASAADVWLSCKTRCR